MPCAETPRGLAHLAFEDASIEHLRRRWPRARFECSDLRAESLAAQVFLPRRAPGTAPNLRLWFAGTGFQVRVWRALLDLDAGETTNYGELARRLGVPGGARAIGNSVGANPIACLISCHKVLRANGALGGYRWGIERKRALLERESDG